MTLQELRSLQRRYERAAARAEELREQRNAAVRQHLTDGCTHQWISDATGLSRGRISQIATGQIREGDSEGDLGEPQPTEDA